MRKLTIATVAVAALVLPVHVAEATPPPWCSAAYEGFNQAAGAGTGISECNRDIQRLMLSCVNPYTLVTYLAYGQWAGPGQRSRGYCESGDGAFAADVQF
ncbi:hypothetical protein ABZ345_42410 [Lentzea sp. NPDC005914]|uniref:hypothetical protein n=1 Tax=Lentzea sp. NPDC005914 TaxID=3154572 RepID=UPI00340930B5